ncbi:unnamed protein product [Microthlaspi erraticum]|uniref:Uncharacterized protein n=1 Tax=Microthlaspi erraticum TaxID=1685480 RepID=A0A6D2JD38_9BRAS|nr:unnamed protein product [Microthlaspi erraticum]
MDFIKTSSLRALSELTLQRNWIGIIWMSRSEDMIKIVKTGPDGFIEHLHPRPRTPADRGTNIPRSSSARIRIPPSPRPSSRPDPESNVPSSRSLARTTSRARPRRANRKAKLAAARQTHVPRPTHPRTGRHRPVTGQVSSAKTHPSVRPVGRTRKLSATIVPTVPMADYDPMTGRPSRPTVRTVDRPEARFEARFTFFTARLDLMPPLKT